MYRRTHEHLVSPYCRVDLVVEDFNITACVCAKVRSASLMCQPEAPVDPLTANCVVFGLLPQATFTMLHQRPQMIALIAAYVHTDIIQVQSWDGKTFLDNNVT